VHHASDEAFCVLRGRLEVLLGEERRILNAGEFLTVPAGTIHTFRTVDADGVDVLAVMTPEVDALVRALHEPMTEQERHDLWERHRSSPA
jgi:mannose-6-phosphate isomerase-like protein (cupin superfamily)